MVFGITVTLRRIIVLGAFLACGAAGLAEPPQYQQLQPAVIEERLHQYSGSDPVRETTLRKLFAEAGCSAEGLKEQPVAGSQSPNVSCTLAGDDAGVIVVGAHFDHVAAGDGVVDNWSGASLLPSLYQSLSSRPRHHTFVFVSFTDEEKGFVGSKSYVESLGKDEIARIKGMVDIDTLGLGPTEIWVTNSDPGLVKEFYSVASTMGLPAREMDVDGEGDSDGHSFKTRQIPIITLHSVTNETFRILHTKRDNISAVKLADYYDSYKLIAGYLAALDSVLK